MQKKTLYYTLPLFGLHFKGEAHSIGQLSAKFQSWCRQYGANDQESLSLWVAGTSRDLNIGTPEQVEQRAKLAISKIPKNEGVIELD